MTQNKIQSNFFDAIGVADMEKVHSAVIGWMLSDKCEAFDIATRSELLQQIFGIEGEYEEFDSIESHIEWKNIDILIVTKKEGFEPKCWVIENKIKSSQHSDQLNRYVQILNCPYLMSSLKYSTYFDSDAEKKEKLRKEWGIKKENNPYWAVKNKSYCFLTLIDEKPISSGNVIWKSTQYSNLSSYLKFALRNANRDSKDYPIIEEYQRCIHELSVAIKDFLDNDNHTRYPNVFTDGYLPKEEKTFKNYEGRAKYISENGLETIFQKCFLSHIIPRTKFGKAGVFNAVEISETHGTALANFPFHSEGDIIFGFQFQDGTFKIQVAGVYDKDDLNASDKIKAFLEHWEKHIPKDQKEPRDEVFNGWKKNESKEGKKAYISISRIQPRKSKKMHQWFQDSSDDICEKWNAVFDDYMKLMKEEIIPRKP